MAASGEFSQQLFDAARCGDVDRLVLTAFERLPLLDAPNPRAAFWTAFHAAAANGHCKAVEALLRLGSRALNLIDADGNTPLHWAVFNGHADVVELLLRTGADRTVRNIVGKRAKNFADSSQLSKAKCKEIRKLFDAIPENCTDALPSPYHLDDEDDLSSASYSQLPSTSQSTESGQTLLLPAGLATSSRADNYLEERVRQLESQLLDRDEQIRRLQAEITRLQQEHSTALAIEQRGRATLQDQLQRAQQALQDCSAVHAQIAIERQNSSALQDQLAAARQNSDATQQQLAVERRYNTTILQQLIDERTNSAAVQQQLADERNRSALLLQQLSAQSADRH